MTYLKRRTAVLILLLSVAFSLRAQLLSVDINKSQVPRSDDTAPGFVGWYDVNTSAQTSSHTFTNYAVTFDPDTSLPVATNIAAIIGCTLTQTYPAFGTPGSSFNTDWQGKKGNSGSPDPNAGFRLSEDGVWVRDTATGNPTNGGALNLAITGLSAGTHTITTYHNSIWATNNTWVSMANPALSRCIISVGGVPVFTNTPSLLVSNDLKCGFSYFSVNYTDTSSPLVIGFAPDHSSPQDFVMLNGFEIDRPSAPGSTATAINPISGDEHAFANNDVPLPGTTNSGSLTLGWLPSGFAVSNYVYFGTSSTAVQNATAASPEFKSAFAVVTNIFVVTNTFNVTNLDSRLTYFWRVDQLNIANGAATLAKGNVWTFRTRHLAFPTAEGYGRFARGGRGGVVIEVTNLNDSGPGSYRAAVAASGPRTVVFRVSGLIRLQSPCVIGNGYLTVAGQTAPGEGICLANWRAGMSSCSDVIMRFMRCRLGDAAQQAMDGIGLGNSTHSIIDHCSISWTMDEASSSRQSGGVGSGSAMITFQHNLISEPLQHSYHYNASNRTNYEQHAFAASISGEIGSYHHNLIAHSTDRNWSLAGGLDQQSHYAGSLDIRNNVVYNWLGRTTDGGVQRCNYVSNYYKPFPANPYATWLLRLDPINTNWGNEFYYMSGNVMEGKNYQTNNWSLGLAVQVGNGTNYATSNQVAQVITNVEVYPSFVFTHNVTNACRQVLSDVGCNLPVPDVIDRRVIGEVLDGTTHYTGTNGNPYIINGVVQPSSSPNYPGFIDSQTDVRDAINSPNAPWPAYATFNVPADSDHDGMPDWWELAKGLNPNSTPGDFSDSNGDPDGDGYSNLEDYLNWLAAIHVDGMRNTNVDVDLTQFTRGFTNNSPTYVVSNPTNGSVSLLAGGKIARFTPTANFYGLGGFQFKVTDASLFSYTNTIGVHVRALPPSQLSMTNSSPVPQLRLTGEAGMFYLIQYSDDLRDWTTWTNTTAASLPALFTVPGFPGSAARFYRTVSVQ